MLVEVLLFKDLIRNILYKNVFSERFLSATLR